MQEFQGDNTSIGLSLITVKVSFIKTNEWEHGSQKQNDKEGMLLVKHQGFHCDLSSLDWEVDRRKLAKG